MTETLTEKTFELIADNTLNEMVEALAETEDEAFDADLQSGVLSIVFEDGTKYVVNSHRAARQIWMSADHSAWHFDYVGKKWISTKSDDELWSLLEARMTNRLGRPLSLRS